MMERKQYELLDGLPTFESMYVSITPYDDEPFFSEGYVIRFFKSDGTDWVANFEPGNTNYYKIFDFPDIKIVVVIAGGIVYIVSVDDGKSKYTFETEIDKTIQLDNDSLVFSNSLGVVFFDITNNETWYSTRISWDGIKDLKVIDNILHGKSYVPTDLTEEWEDFTINLKTKEIVGGSWRDFLKNNPNLVVSENGMLREQKIIKKKPWWKIL